MFLARLCPCCLSQINEYGVCCSSLLEDIVEAYFATQQPVIIDGSHESSFESFTINHEEYYKIYRESYDASVLDFLEKKNLIRSTEFGLDKEGRDLIAVVPSIKDNDEFICFKNLH